MPNDHFDQYTNILLPTFLPWNLYGPERVNLNLRVEERLLILTKASLGSKRACFVQLLRSIVAGRRGV